MIGDVIRTRTVITALAVVSVLALGACSDDEPEPRLAPPESSAPTSPSTTAASGPTEPTMPPEANGTDAAAAEAFVRFYWEMVDYAEASGDLDGLRSVSYENCESCQRGLKFLESVFARNGRLRGGVTTVSSLSSGRVGTHAERWIVRFGLSNTRQVVDYPGTARDQVFDAGRVQGEAVVLHSRDGWTLEYFGERS